MKLKASTIVEAFFILKTLYLKSYSIKIKIKNETFSLRINSSISF